MDETDLKSLEFNNTLELAREGKMNKHYRYILEWRLSRFKMGQSEFQRRGFDGDKVSRLLYNKKDADNYNDY